ncbi:MAG TPA: hypothetical protein VGH69_11450 [Mycobacterium sp.]
MTKAPLPDERLEQLARQLLADGYVSTEEEARLAASEVLAATAAMPTERDGGATRPTHKTATTQSEPGEAGAPA